MTNKFKNRELKVDIVLLSVIDNELAVFLIKRPYEPFKDKLALPGGFIPDNMTADEAAKYQLYKKTGLENVYLDQLALFSDTDRDPTGNIASMAYISLVDSTKLNAMKTKDASDFEWVKLSDLKNNLAFDHNKIIKKAQERMITQIRYTKVGFELAGNEFTIREIVSIFQSVTKTKKLDLSNVRKKMLKLNLLIDTGKVKKDGPGRPSPVYKLNLKEYKKLELGESFFN